MLKRFEAQERPVADQALLSWAFHDAIYRIQVALSRFVENFPVRWARAILSIVVFPLGRRERQPGDRLTHKVAQLLLAPSDTRSRLCQGIYVSAATGHPVGLLEEALPRVILAEPLERKLQKAVGSGDVAGYTFEERLGNALEAGVLTEAEARILSEANELAREIIAVDDFDSEELRLGQKQTKDLAKQYAA